LQSGHGRLGFGQADQKIDHQFFLSFWSVQQQNGCLAGLLNVSAGRPAIHPDAISGQTGLDPLSDFGFMVGKDFRVGRYQMHLAALSG
jgi:hypothetical protein